MAYLDAPSIPDGRVAMLMRTFAWGLTAGGQFDDEPAIAAISAHTAGWPAATKMADETTAALSPHLAPFWPLSGRGLASGLAPLAARSKRGWAGIPRPAARTRTPPALG
ncbi:hypothetical protein Misp01_10940 [Microtetraspora sp. NBRC 13810]|nr:hypothetical protein Misp01_10940 [Microtetraspora sp. NBRC 13810]